MGKARINLFLFFLALFFVQEMSDGMRELYNQITRLSESNRQKESEGEALEKALKELKSRYEVGKLKREEGGGRKRRRKDRN